jgi:hypothetical protein
LHFSGGVAASASGAETRKRRPEVGDELIRRLLRIPRGSASAAVLASIAENVVRLEASARWPLGRLRATMVASPVVYVPVAKHYAKDYW